MKDYESYRNNGNKDIPDNPKLKKNEFYNRQFQDNILPGEYYDCRVNGLECELDDNDKFAYDSGEKGAKQSELDDIQELTNAVGNTSSTAATSSSSSIVESAGTVITGTATVVVGASAAVVAFNAISKDIPKLKVNSIEAGSRYVHYNVEAINLDLSKDYNIIVKNGYHSFKIECSSGVNDEWVYDLRPGLQYSLTLVGTNGFGDLVEYSSTTFETMRSTDIVGYSNIDVIFNDDLTCGIKYDTTLVDDFNTINDTYIVVKEYVNGQGDEEWELFNSLYANEYINEEPNKYSYSYSNKVHKGSISEVQPGQLIIELYKMGPSGEEENGELISSTKKEIVYPIYEKSDSNYIEFIGDYDLIKEVKNINIKKDNLVVKLSLYNENNVETKIEKEIDISNGKFDYRQLVKQDTNGYSYKIGYYKADKTFVVVKEKTKEEFYGGYYGAYYNPIFGDYDRDTGETNLNKFNIKWNYDSDDNETMDIKILTEFDNYGNNDCYYKVDLLRKVYHEDGDPTYEIVDTYIGRSDAVFKNVPTYVYYNELGETGPAFYRFAYTSLMNYYDEEKGTVQVVMGTYEDDYYENSYMEDITINSGSIIFRGDGSFETSLDIDYEMGNKVGAFVTADATLHFYKDDYNVITDTLTVSGSDVARWLGNYAYLVFDKKFPTDIVGAYVTYEINYREAHGNNVRKAKSKEMILLGDIGYQVEASLEEITVYDSYTSGRIVLSAYMPDDAVLKARVGYSGDPIDVPIVNGKYVYEFEELSGGETVYVDVYDSNGNQFSNQAYSFYSNTSNYDYDEGYISYYKDDSSYHTIFTYNDDGTVNIYCDTGMAVNYEDLYNQTSYSMNVYLDATDINEGDLYSGSRNVTEKNKIATFNNVKLTGASSEYNFRYDWIRDTTETYLAKRKVTTHVGSGFLMTESNFNSMHPAGQLIGYTSYDEDLGKTLISLNVPVGMKYDKNQTVIFETYLNPEDERPITTSLKLSDCLVSSTSDGDYYVFDIDEQFFEGGGVDIYMMYNYTLTEDNYNVIKNIYSGSLYKKYSVYVTGV